MKVQVEKGSLVQVLQKVQSITDKKTSMPILANALLKTVEGEQEIEFSATDLELSIRTRIPANVETPGNTTVSAKKLLEIVREIPQDYVVLEESNMGKMLISAGRSRFELSTIPSDDFPSLNFYEEDIRPVKCDASLLRKSLNKTFYSIPSDDDPFSISGLYCHPLDSGRLRFVSSDGHRLAYYELPQDSFRDLEIGPQGIIIPRKGVQEILRVLEKENEVAMALVENSLIMCSPNSILGIRLLEAEFPEYTLIIPEERPYSFLIDWEVFYHALKRVGVVTDLRWRHVRFVITKGTLELESGNPEIGNANDVLDIDYEGEDFTVAFNIRYLMETIQVMESPMVRFEWVDEFHGGIFLGAEDPDYLSLIMPMVV